MSKEYFIRTKGKHEFKTYHLICIDDFNMLDIFFDSALEAQKSAEKNLLKIVDYKEDFDSK